MSKLLVYGGAGALGRSLVQHFKSKGYAVINVDLIENEEADFNTAPNTSVSLAEQGQQLSESVGQWLGTDKLSAILCVAGGWAGGHAGSQDFLKNADMMIHQSVHSSLIAAHLASKYLDQNGLLTLTGALAALEATPGMIGYGIAKASVHHLVKDLAVQGGLPEGAKVTAILPVTIDTPMNRKFMSSADFSTWTSPKDIASQLEGYLTGSTPLTNGSLISVVTKDNITTFNEI
ncbi:Dihydropteridine reductase [Choanephora cucurbitarum]|uniref:Dihydropteridine reductase n=1 Tax=Choanephora cucurbitarum TaxID=101091 RepID=A0A1C7N5F1_9FUNG|nr:Dihydropteridine reductase [Choanephora cucurbitarum]